MCPQPVILGVFVAVLRVLVIVDCLVSGEGRVRSSSRSLQPLDIKRWGLTIGARYSLGALELKHTGDKVLGRTVSHRVILLTYSGEGGRVV